MTFVSVFSKKEKDGLVAVTIGHTFLTNQMHFEETPAGSICGRLPLWKVWIEQTTTVGFTILS